MEELDFKTLLETLTDFDRGERVILGHFGTVQTLLSLVFDRPVSVKVVDQSETDGVLVRQTQLMVEHQMLCLALSRIPRYANRTDVVDDVCGGRLGLGQIIANRQISAQRSLVDVGRDRLSFWRVYTIRGADVCIHISETFIRKPFEAAGWTLPVPGLVARNQAGKRGQGNSVSKRRYEAFGG